MSTESKEKRKLIRVPLLSDSCQWKPMDGTNTQESALLDFTKQGCFIISAKPVAVKSYICVYFTLPGSLGIVKVDGKVTWNRWAKRKDDTRELGFGVEFIDVPDYNDKILGAYQEFLRNKQIIAVSKRIVEEFFGKVPPTVKI